MNQGGQQASNSHLIGIWEMKIFHFCPTKTTKISYDLMAILKKQTFCLCFVRLQKQAKLITGSHQNGCQLQIG